MVDEAKDRDACLARLSALADGEIEASAIALACGHWRDDAALRSSWHAYMLIGDVLRSEDLAASPVRDAAFLAGVRNRLADEPVVLAPSAPRDGAAGRAVGRPNAPRRWLAPAAVAAGFVAVFGVVTLLGTPFAPTGSTTVASLDGSSAVGGRGPDFVPSLVAAASPGAPSVLGRADPETQTFSMAAPAFASVSGTPAEGALAPSAEPQVVVASGKLIRDARLDRYLAAHQQFAGSSALGVPSAFLRSATIDGTGR